MLRRSLALFDTRGMKLRDSFRRVDKKARSYPDAGDYNRAEYGSTAYDQVHVRGRGSSRQIQSIDAIRKQVSRERTSGVIMNKISPSSPSSGGDENQDQQKQNRRQDWSNHPNHQNKALQRAQDLMNYADPKTKGEIEYTEDQFARELQLRDRIANTHRNKSGSEKRKTTTDLPIGMRVHKGAENLLRKNNMSSPSSNHASDLFSNEKAPLPYTSRMHKWQTAKELTKLQSEYRNISPASIPSTKEYTASLRQLAREDSMDQEVSHLHERLIDEAGLYPSQRLDAYMLQDESIFPQWVNELSPNMRDRVRYGGIGLTDEDEVLRQNLARMPPEEREDEWHRLKAARAYKQGTLERKVNPSEVRQLRLGIRRHHQLHKIRLRKAIDLKRLTLRRPEKHEAWPSRDVDFSARLATVAKFVEAGVPTKGQWPLDVKELNNASRKKLIAEEAQKAFVDAGVALSSSMPNSEALTLGPGMKSIMKRLDTKQREVKRISKKRYANRLNAIAAGFKDEHGRKFHVMERNRKDVRRAAFKSEEEIRMSKELLPFVVAEDNVNKYRKNKLGGANAQNNQWEGYQQYAEERKGRGMANKHIAF